MQEYENKQKAVAAFKKLGDTTKNEALLEMLNDGIIDLAPAMTAYAQHLDTYKKQAKEDMRTLSLAGLELAQAQRAIKRIPDLKTLDRRQLQTAWAQTLLSGGGYLGTPMQKKIEKSIDMSIVDAKWYADSWALHNPVVPMDGGSNEQTD